MKPKKSKNHAAAEVPAADEFVPTLTEVVAAAPPSTENLTALQAELVTRVHKLAEELLHGACREMEAVLFEKVCDRLRAKLPELIDETVRAQLK